MFISEISDSFEKALATWTGTKQDWRHPHPGPQGEPLRTHALIKPGDPERVLASVSGTHGAEAFVGSLIQQKILHELPHHPQRSAPPTVVFIHNLNCFGSAWVRRGNQSNVDLNRNSWRGERPHNPEFILFEKWLTAKSKLEFWQGFAKATIYLPSHGLSNLMKIVAQGQSDFQDCLFYTGHERSFELRQLQQFLRESLSPRHLTVLDIHTGLGAFKQESLIAGGTPLDAKKKLATEHLLRAKFITVDHPGFYPCLGILEELMLETFPKAEVLHITQEFGTRHFLKVLETLVLEGAQWKATHELEPDRVNPMLHCFFPSEKDWREHVVARGVQRFFELYDTI